MIAFIGERHTNPNLVQQLSKFGALGINAVVWNDQISQGVTLYDLSKDSR